MKHKRCSLSEFGNYIENKTIVCYGIGEEFRKIERWNRGYLWQDKVAGLVDGNEKRRGERVDAFKKEYFIKSIEDLVRMNPLETVVLITCIAYEEVIERLDKLEKLKDMECYSFHRMLSLGNDEIIKIRQSDTMRIPNIIHYCWFGRTDLPIEAQRCIESWKKFCPEYTIVRWDESNCDVNTIAFTKEAYRMKKYAFVSDYFRLKAIYENGGIYLDTDVEIVKSLNDLRYNIAFAGMEKPGVLATGLGFGAIPYNELVHEFMDYYKNIHFLKDDGSIMNIPCPKIQSAIVKKKGMIEMNELQVVEGMTIYPMEVLSGKNIYTGEIVITDNTYAIHHFAASWV